jgi:cysteine desulfurase / selenocysteine lyase
MHMPPTGVSAYGCSRPWTGQSLCAQATASLVMDVGKIRAQFPILKVQVPSTSGKPNPLRYFDHAASTHAPRPVIDAVVDLAESGYANVHRANYHLSRAATDAFEGARASLIKFIGGNASENEILFSQNTTSAIEMAAHIMSNVPGDTVITHLEHHSNDLPHRRRGRVHRVDPEGDMNSLPGRIEAVLRRHKVKLVAITGASNVTGEAPDIHAVAKIAHEYDAKILVDAAQRFAHRPINVRKGSDASHIDFLVAAGHKSYAPFGSSLLFGPRDMLDRAPPTTPGGGTVVFVDRENAHFGMSPDRHEGGTPNVLGVVAFAAAVRWLSSIGMDAVEEHERALSKRLRATLARVDGLRTYKVGGAPDKLGVETFNLDGWSHQALSTALDDGWGVACRDGCFCAHPLMVDLLGVDDVAAVQEQMLAGKRERVPGMVRASLGIYSNQRDIDVLGEALSTLSQRPKPKPRLVVSASR